MTAHGSIGWKPLGSHIIVMLQPVKEYTARGIFLPDLQRYTLKEPSQLGTVLAVGPRVREVKPADWVLVGKYAMFGDTVPGGVILDVDDVMAVVEV